MERNNKKVNINGDSIDFIRSYYITTTIASGGSEHNVGKTKLK